MAKHILLIAIIFLFISCDDNDKLTIIKTPGRLMGKIYPPTTTGEATIQQGELKKTVKANENSYFEILDIEPGVYNLIVKANNYGSKIIENVKIEDGEGYDIGVIELSQYPNPLYRHNPSKNGIMDVFYEGNSRRRNANSNGAKVTLEFSEKMDIATLQDYIRVEPSIDNLYFDGYFEEYTNSRRHRFYIYGDYEPSKNYSVYLDTNIQTYWGDKLEFPYEFNFYTNSFSVSNFYYNREITGNNELRISFNNEFTEFNSDNYILEPNIEMVFQIINNSIILTPVKAWIPDTEFSLTLLSNINDIEGNYLQKDTAFTFKSEKLKVTTTRPLNGDESVDEYKPINVVFNSMLDEESIKISDAIVIIPEVSFGWVYHVGSSRRGQIVIYPDSLQSKTDYTIQINTSLKDYYGNSISEPYSFSFKTR